MSIEGCDGKIFKVRSIKLNERIADFKAPSNVEDTARSNKDWWIEDGDQEMRDTVRTATKGDLKIGLMSFRVSTLSPGFDNVGRMMAREPTSVKVVPLRSFKSDDIIIRIKLKGLADLRLKMRLSEGTPPTLRALQSRKRRGAKKVRVGT